MSLLTNYLEEKLLSRADLGLESTEKISLKLWAMVLTEERNVFSGP